ncbi:MAG: helix-turn-helix domain-containing protein [Arachnia sp.]
MAYRIRRAEQRLGVDLKDPDARFGVHLACRIQALGRPIAAQA